ncbi:MAG: energy transducer TonB [Bacteroidota bacterium]
MNLIQQLFHLLTYGRSENPTSLASLDEEVFADREQSYGSFELRKNQHWYLLTATGLVLSSVLAIVFVPIWMGWNLPNKVKRHSTASITPWIEQHHSSTYDFHTFDVFPPEERYICGTSILAMTYADHLPFSAPLYSEDMVDEPVAPSIHEFIFADQEPIPLNLPQVQEQIPFPAGYPSGRVVVRVLVDTEGNTVKHVFISNSDPLLIEALSPYLGTLKWKPAIQEGKEIPFWVNIPFVFRGIAGK